jgi:N-acetylglutamate synthase-like GNAT family acetyltransferase/DNA-binding MarR family transcriptional regulator
VFKLLQANSDLTVTEIANKIGFAHPSVISIVNKMIKNKYLEEKRNSRDSRQRILSLTPKAEEKMPEFEKIWNAGVGGMKKMLEDLDALTFLEIIEQRVNEKGFRKRALAEIPRQQTVEVFEFKDKYAADFARLNYEWIENYFEVEKHDREMLDNAKEYIINRDGQIFVAEIKGEAVGTVALIKTDEESFELAKMAVTSKFRGLKIGDKLMSACIDYAKRLGKKRIFLLSNTKLIPAINLYKKFGFIEVTLEKSEYLRTNIKMELLLDENK